MLVVRRANPAADKDDILGILSANLPYLNHARRFQWLYFDNPSGPAWSWFVCEKQSGRPVGLTSLFPRSICLAGQEQHCGQVGDFAIERAYRSLGPALSLQKATFEPVNDGTLAFCYDCPPHEAGMSTFRRLSIRENAIVQRFARPLRVDLRLEKSFGEGPWIKPLAALGNTVLGLRGGRRRADPGVEIERHTGPFGDEFTRLDRQVGRNAIRGRRRAEDLNWRFRQNPLTSYRVFAARARGELAGFAVLEDAQPVAKLADLFGRKEVVPSLLRVVAEESRNSGAQTLEAFATAGSPLAGSLRQAWFALRSDAARVVAYAKPGNGASQALASGGSWSFGAAELQA
jgi:hypothetical protein